MVLLFGGAINNMSEDSIKTLFTKIDKLTDEVAEIKTDIAVLKENKENYTSFSKVFGWITTTTIAAVVAIKEIFFK